MTDKLSATMRIANRTYALAETQNDSALMIGACRAVACTFYFLGDFETARQYAMRGTQIWRLGGVQSPVEEVMSPAVICMCYLALSQWHLGEVACSQVAMSEGISLAKKLKDTHALGQALWFAGFLGHFEYNPAEVERLTSDLIELSARQNFASWSPGAEVLRGWARGVCGDTAVGILWIENGIASYRSAGWMLAFPYWIALKAETLHLAGRSSEALDAINEAEAVVVRREERWWCAELHRLRGVFLTAIGGDETQINASFCEAIRTAKQQKSISLEKRAEATYAEYRKQKATGPRERGFRLRLC
jgi:predicted ATPase